MRIALAHNYYLQAGGEDRVFQDELTLLKEKGHEVFAYIEDNKRIEGTSSWKVGLRAVWSRKSFIHFMQFLETCKPEIVHFHNTFPLISPSAYNACREYNVPVVQTLHNYRLICPTATFFRDGRVCEDCLGKFLPWPGIWHACYRDSRPATAAVALMLTIQKALGRWSENADIYIALTEFARDRFIQGGFQASRLMIKPNYFDYKGKAGSGGGGYALFAGRLMADKGVDVMLRAWEVDNLPWNLKIAGDGPLRAQVERRIENCPNVEYLGSVNQSEIIELMQSAEVLVVPSLWYEGFPRVIAEAYSIGLPVVVSNLGSLSTIVKHHETGMHFPAGDHVALRDSICRLASNPTLLRSMKLEARKAYEAYFSKDVSYKLLMDIYHEAIDHYASHSM
jgi:glycosyltransferase involved in cell wall biosynthesis